jgi:NADH-quinone oxidoreductase subunit J
MNAIFWISAAVAVASTAMVVTRRNAVHALLYLILSLLAAAMVFFTLGAPFVAALEVIIYAGAIMILFVFVVMMLNPGPAVIAQEKEWFSAAAWIGPAILAAVLLGELVYALFVPMTGRQGVGPVGPRQVAFALLDPHQYILAVELASLLLLSGLIGAYHLGRHEETENQGAVT